MNGGARLYRVRGRRPVLVQLEPVSWAQLAADGVFVLDTSSLLVLWLGRAANLVEKIFGAKVTCMSLCGLLCSWLEPGSQLVADGVFLLD